MILQAYDVLELYRRHGCTLQMGGSDQWGNIINGIELGRRTDQAQLYALTTELLTTSSGAKMGKTAQGAVWLDAEMLSAWEYWQFWRNTEDSDVGRFLRLFTECPLVEISRLEQLEGAELNEAFSQHKPQLWYMGKRQPQTVLKQLPKLLNPAAQARTCQGLTCLLKL